MNETAALRDVIAERERQKLGEGWTLAHDDTHDRGQMARAAACYAYFAALPDTVREFTTLDGLTGLDEVIVLRHMWHWHREWWKPKDRRRDLVRAAALLVAEIERLDRVTARGEAKETEKTT